MNAPSFNSTERISELEYRLPFERHKQQRLHILQEISSLSYRIDPKKALTSSKEAVDISLALHKDKEVASSLLLTGSSRHILSLYDSAIDDFTAALDIFEKLHDRSSTGDALHKLAGIYAEFGDYERSLKLCQEALQIRSESNEYQKMADTLTVMYSVHERIGNFRDALECSYLSYEFSESINNITRVGLALINRGKIYFLIGDVFRAQKCSEEGLICCQNSGDIVGNTHALITLGKILEQQNEFYKAKEHFFDARALSRKIEDKNGESVSLLNLARLQLKQQKFEAAADLAREAIEIALSIGNMRTCSELYGQIGAALAGSHNENQALEYLYSGLLLAEENGDIVTQIAILKNMAEIYEISGDSGKALQFYKKYALAAVEFASRRSQVNVAELDRGFHRYLEASDADFHFVQALLFRYPTLTPSEIKVCRSIKNKFSSKEISAQLSVSVRTVENHRYNIRAKLGIPPSKSLTSFLTKLG